jgi:hypothetical protein
MFAQKYSTFRKALQLPSQLSCARVCLLSRDTLAVSCGTSAVLCARVDAAANTIEQTELVERSLVKRLFSSFFSSNMCAVQGSNSVLDVAPLSFPSDGGGNTTSPPPIVCAQCSDGKLRVWTLKTLIHTHEFLDQKDKKDNESSPSSSSAIQHAVVRSYALSNGDVLLALYYSCGGAGAAAAAVQLYVVSNLAARAAAGGSPAATSTTTEAPGVCSLAPPGGNGDAKTAAAATA